MSLTRKVRERLGRGGDPEAERIEQWRQVRKGRGLPVPHDERDDDDSSDRAYIEAAKGFHGFVDHPTLFLAGEAGREHVNITPVHRKGKGKKKSNHVEPAFRFDISDFKLPGF